MAFPSESLWGRPQKNRLTALVGRIQADVADHSGSDAESRRDACAQAAGGADPRVPRRVRNTSPLEPSLVGVARMLRAHEPLILNWFRAKKEISNGAVEGMNNKIKSISHRSFGFRTAEDFIAAIYHCCARLPLPIER